MTTNTFDPFVTVATLRENKLAMCLRYRLGAKEWELLTHSTRTGLARFRPSNHPAPTVAKPDTFTDAVAFGLDWLHAARTQIWVADRERINETAADYLR